MARCLGSMVWPCDHEQKHSEAAKKGWLTRRHGASFASTRAHQALSSLFGEEISHAHDDPTHKGMIRFKHGGKWYELPKGAFNNLVHEGEALQREQAREERDKERKTARAQKDEERAQIQEQHLRQAQEKQLAAAHKAEYQNVTRRIRDMGGIRPYKASSAAGKKKAPELEEWKDLPKSVKTTCETCGQPPDEMAASINEEFPWLKIQDDKDLRAYLTNKKNRVSPIAAAWFQPPAPKPEQPKIVVSQSGGKWIITRLYPDGHVAGQPGTYPSKAAAEKAAAGMKQGVVVKPAMFAEREESYAPDLFQ